MAIDDVQGPSAQELLSLPHLAPLVPMLYVAWTDGELTPEEIRALGAAARSQHWLDLRSTAVLANWLDPLNPPSPSALAQVGEHIRRTAERLSRSDQKSLVELGAHLAEAIGGKDALPAPMPELARSLAPVETALGVSGAEAVRTLVAVPKLHAVKPPEPHSFSVEALRAVLERTYSAERASVREWLADPAFRYVDERDTAAYRAQVLAWLKQLAARGLGQFAYPGNLEKVDLGRFIAAFETLAFFDLSLVVKAGVHFGLFGGSIYFLGTERHHREYLPRVASVELPGCFAMSELGHGSNVRDVETLARYDAERGEFVVHTPSESARKEWIGNAAQHARVATVFAQLEVKGERHGVHALLVPLRDEEGRLLPGVRVEDCGLKMGLNGVDNGRLWFDGVRVPRENLLDRFSRVSPEGEYSSAIPGVSKRFFTMLGTLVAGRVSVACAALSAAKSGLSIAISYGDERRQFGPAGAQEVRLLDYQAHQLRLLRPLATTYALDFALKHLVKRYVGRTEEDALQVEALAAGLKAYASRHTTHTLQVAREACGGQGYLVANRLPSLKADTDVFATFEGDNTVLLQLVAKSLLTGYRQQFEDDRVFTVMRLIVDRASGALGDRNPFSVRRTGSEHLRDGDFQLRALRFRESDLLASAARRLRERLSSGVDSFEAFNQCQDHLLALALAHVERVVLEQFLLGVAEVEDPALKSVLGRLCDVYGLGCLQDASGWFLENDHLEGAKAKAIRKEVTRLCAELRPDAVALTKAFGIPGTCLAAPIALGRPSP
ncbi:acyl-coenzyme A oxidase [Archangium gephyra]|uniref:acyl-CoA oxidase n=1 Tax=Archangium gephyra TaxID=48 RepID=A0AAC8Q5A7_9BACT|nr:acyl-CoA dehydrogenase [Archangium gephyra]AKJ01384.1 Acyl-coenzyme A oxidase 1, peroxisomal [Archangium gephyra]REG34201.1 acyl-coenzyme A oxidase [Archangium gephyra]